MTLIFFQDYNRWIKFSSGTWLYIEIDKLFICNKHNKRWLNEERQSFAEVAELRRLSHILKCSGSNPLNNKPGPHEFVVTSNIALQRCEHNQDIIISNGNWSERDVLCMKYIFFKVFNSGRFIRYFLNHGPWL